MKDFKGTIALLASAILWGFEIVFAKDVIVNFEPNWTNVIRYSIAFFMALVIWKKEFAAAGREEWKRGLLSGVFMGFGFSLQNMGLDTINAGVSGFLCATYVLIIPFIIWVLRKVFPGFAVMGCVLIAMTGVTLMSSSGMSLSDFNFSKGEILTFGSAVCYAFGIVTTDLFAKDLNDKFLAGTQFLMTAAIGLGMALLFEDIPPMISLKTGIEFAYVIIFGGFLAQILFTYGMKTVSSIKASMIFLSESVVALIGGVLILGETVSFINIVGAVLILSAIALQSVVENRRQ